MSRSLRLVSLALATLMLSGCAFPDGVVGRAFDAVSAPVWEAGYKWSYDLTATSQESGFSGGGIDADSDSDHAVVEMRVLNTTTSVDDEPVYVLKVDHDTIDHPFLRGDFQALRQSDLAMMAYGYDHQMMPEDHSRYDPCQNQPSLQKMGDEERFPTAPFPLDDGTEITEKVGLEGAELYEYSIKVHGVVDVEVPAGEFRAVYITTDIRAIPVEDAQAEDFRSGLSFHLRTEQWYSEDARNFVKSVVSASAESAGGRDGSFRFAYRSVMELSRFSLQAGQEEFAPVAQEPEIVPRAEPVRGYEIVTDTLMPVNIAEGSVLARFALKEGGDAYGTHQRNVAQVEEFPAESVIDEEKYQVVWRVRSMSGPDYFEAEFPGSVLNYSFERGGIYNLRAEIRGRECGDPWLGTAFGSASAYWGKSFRVDLPPGNQQMTEIAPFPVEPNAVYGTATWEIISSTVVPIDQGHPVFISPEGERQTIPGSRSGTSFSPYPAGQWILAWESENFQIGDDLEILLEIWYDGTPTY